MSLNFNPFESGSVIIFVALLSVGFLDRRLVRREWTGIFFVIIGLAVVGLADFVSNNADRSYSRNNIITGDLLIIMAQIITAVQMVYEERFVAGMDIPALQGNFCVSCFLCKCQNRKKTT